MKKHERAHNSAMAVRRELREGAYVYKLENGILTVCAADSGDNVKKVLWRSDSEWWVDDFDLGDVDGDGETDFLMSLWKSYSFGKYHPSYMDNDDKTVACHLFLYTMRGKYAKALWCSSTLPRPVYALKLDPSGRKTPVASGMLLHTAEGSYTKDFSRTAAHDFLYAWEGWGFTPR